MQLNPDSVVLVTGASRGVGKGIALALALALALAESGATVYVSAGRGCAIAGNGVCDC